MTVFLGLEGQQLGVSAMPKPFLAVLCGLAMHQMTLAAPSEPPPSPPIEILPLDTAAGAALRGAGGERLQQALGDAQFVAVGEDHGFSGPPQLAAALAAAWSRLPGPPVALAVEVGPVMTAHAARVLKADGLRGLDVLLDGDPAALPFLAMVEDARLAQPFAAANRLWGIDQEFIGSAPALYVILAERTRNPVLAERLRGLAKADRAAFSSGRFAEASLNRTPLNELAALKADFASDAGAGAIMTGLADSARIYQLNEAGRYFENNQQRSQLMTQQFLARYHSANAPRVLIKAGAFHLGRGITPTGIFDLGSMLPGLAAARGRQSLHIAHVPLSGRVRTIAPGPQGFTSIVDHREEAVAQLLAAGGITPEQLPAQGEVLIPLAPIRARLGGKGRRELPEFARFMLLGFDYLVTSRDAAPATHFEAWAPVQDRALASTR